MKLRAYRKPEEKETEAELLIDIANRSDGDGVVAFVCNENGQWRQTLLEITSKGVRRIYGIDPKFGFPVDENGRLKVLD